MARVARLDRDGELLHRRVHAVRRQRRSAQILGAMVLRAPLAGLPVHDEVGATDVRDGPEGVGPRRQRQSRERDRSRGGELGRGIRSSAPDTVVAEHVAQQRAPARQGAAVVHREGRRADRAACGIAHAELLQTGASLGRRESIRDGVDVGEHRGPCDGNLVGAPHPRIGQHPAAVVDRHVAGARQPVVPQLHLAPAARMHKAPVQGEARPYVPVRIELPEGYAVALREPGRHRPAKRRRDLQFDDAVHHRYVRHRDGSAGGERRVPHPAVVTDRNGHGPGGKVRGDPPSALPRRPAVRGANIHHHVPDGAVGGQVEFGVPPPDERPSIHAVRDQSGG